MKQALVYGLVGVLAYGGFLAAGLPAAALLPYAAPYLPGLAVAQVEGSVLAGRAESVSLREARVENLHWRWQPLGLLGGRLDYQLKVSEPQFTLTTVVGVDWSHTLSFQDTQGELPLRRALTLLPRAQLPVNGTVALDLDEVRLGRNGLPTQVEGQVQVRQLRTTLGRPLELGDFKVDLTTAEQGIVGTVTELQGPLQVEGSLALAADGRYRFSGRVGLRDSENQDLRQALALLGRPGADGQWKIDFNGVLKR